MTTRLHFLNRLRNFGPKLVDNAVQFPQREYLQFWHRFIQKGDDAGYNFGVRKADGIVYYAKLT